MNKKSYVLKLNPQIAKEELRLDVLYEWINGAKEKNMMYIKKIVDIFNLKNIIKKVATKDKTNNTKEKISFFNPLKSVINAKPIKILTAQLIPTKAALTTSYSIIFSRTVDIKIIITKDGITTPIVAKIDPKTLPTRYPTKVAILIAIGPGVDSEIVIISSSSSSVIHFFFSTNSLLIKDIIAYPPPKVNAPILNIVKNIIKYCLIFFILLYLTYLIFLIFTTKNPS